MPINGKDEKHSQEHGNIDRETKRAGEAGVTKDIQKAFALKIAWSFLGLPYIWGGDDPVKGFDCSGFIIEILKSVGILPHKGDWAAHDLWRKFRSKETKTVQPGCLVFWQNHSGRATHVEMCIDEELSIGASGGRSNTENTEDAAKQNAYIKVRPFKDRGMIKAIIDPFMD